MSGFEQVRIIDASVRTHDGSPAETCGGCGVPMAPGNVIEFTLRSTRPAQVRARLHPVCAVRFVDGAPVELAGSTDSS